jgi:hypothetical protein
MILRGNIFCSSKGIIVILWQEKKSAKQSLNRNCFA